MIIVVLVINTYLQPSTFFYTNPHKYDLSWTFSTNPRACSARVRGSAAQFWRLFVCYFFKKMHFHLQRELGSYTYNSSINNIKTKIKHAGCPLNTLPKSDRKSFDALRENLKTSWIIQNQKTSARQAWSVSVLALQSPSRGQTTTTHLPLEWVRVNRQLPRSAAGLGGARCPDAAGASPAGTSGCYNPPGRAATSCAPAAAPGAGWSACSAGCCYPKLRGRAGSCRPWSRWRWGCDPKEPRRFCTISWTWISGSGTKSSPETNKRINLSK